MSGKALTFLLLLSSTLRGEKTNLSDGIYTEAQAEDCVELYTTYCAYCHLPEFHVGIQITWSGMSVLDFDYKISGSMPADEPRALNQIQYLKIVA